MLLTTQPAGVIAGSGLFFRDTFTDTDGTLIENHTGDYGDGWTKHPNYTGSATIQNNRFVHTVGANSAYYSNAVPPTADYFVQCRFVVMAVDGHTGLCGRMDPTANTFYMVRYNNSGFWQLNSVVAGSFTSLATYTVTRTVSAVHLVRLWMQGTTIKMFVDGVERASVTDSAISGVGRAGFRVLDQTNNDQVTSTLARRLG